MSRIFLLTLLGALALPSMAQSNPSVSVSLGSFYPGGSASGRNSQTSFSYTPHLKGSTVLNLASVYLDTTRTKSVVGTGTTAVTTATAMEGLGLSWRANKLPVTQTGVYQIFGVGLYRRRVSNGTTETKGTSPGGKLGIGYQKNAIYVEADYSFIGRIKGTDPSGLGLRFGVRI